ncbi:hypothetical protein [Paenibacillus sp. GCM10012303]|uniref:hypothetical protein n=1 Tax=Paenibacillus sp. GCM10012303 TaxID=3317340 RepID=UPI0036D3AF2F
MAVPVPETIKDFSEAEIAGHLFSRLKELDVAYEDVANCMLFKGKRVGLAYHSELPVC